MTHCPPMGMEPALQSAVPAPVEMQDPSRYTAPGGQGMAPGFALLEGPLLGAGTAVRLLAEDTR